MIRCCPARWSFWHCAAPRTAVCVLTNNSSKSKADYHRSSRLGADVTEHDIFTSGDATLLYLAENRFSKISCSSAPSLEAQFAAEGYKWAAKPRRGAGLRHHHL
ncbi:MAG: hypothetical protein ACLUJ0_08540 [Ruthenibacterium lactatiformans]|uniref:hypothetical protein n=1 Tax=Ruthenibacterium lactatiformans TaxID=1550024 RepID=UPI003991A296